MRICICSNSMTSNHVTVAPSTLRTQHKTTLAGKSLGFLAWIFGLFENSRARISKVLTESHIAWQLRMAMNLSPHGPTKPTPGPQGRAHKAPLWTVLFLTAPLTLHLSPLWIHHVARGLPKISQLRANRLGAGPAALAEHLT